MGEGADAERIEAREEVFRRGGHGGAKIAAGMGASTLRGKSGVPLGGRGLQSPAGLV